MGTTGNWLACVRSISTSDAASNVAEAVLVAVQSGGMRCLLKSIPDSLWGHLDLVAVQGGEEAKPAILIATHQLTAPKSMLNCRAGATIVSERATDDHHKQERSVVIINEPQVIKRIEL